MRMAYSYPNILRLPAIFYVDTTMLGAADRNFFILRVPEHRDTIILGDLQISYKHLVKPIALVGRMGA